MTPQEIKSLFLLHEDITFLNFGSFGACPKPIFDKYQEFQREFEEDPVNFYKKKGMDYLAKSKMALSEFIHCDIDDIVLVTNPTYAVNLIAKNLRLERGDEILATDIEYGANDKVLEYYCEQKGAKYIRQKIEFPLESKEHFIEQFWKGLTSNTKLIFICSITSSTGLRLPAEEICAKANELGIPCFIDGAHAPGQIDIDLNAINPTYYTGACHKWMMTPRGCTFLYVKKEAQNSLDPLIVSWGYKSMFPSHSQFQDYHQVNGTRDFTPFLTIPVSIDFMKKYNWKEVAFNSHKLVIDNALRLNVLLGTEPIVPISGEFLCQMYSARIYTDNPEHLQEKLYDQFKIQIPVIRQDEKSFIRYSVQGFNSQNDLDRLFEALKLLL